MTHVIETTQKFFGSRYTPRDWNQGLVPEWRGSHFKDKILKIKNWTIKRETLATVPHLSSLPKSKRHPNWNPQKWETFPDLSTFGHNYIDGAVFTKAISSLTISGHTSEEGCRRSGSPPSKFHRHPRSPSPAGSEGYEFVISWFCKFGSCFAFFLFFIFLFVIFFGTVAYLEALVLLNWSKPCLLRLNLFWAKITCYCTSSVWHWIHEICAFRAVSYSIFRRFD